MQSLVHAAPKANARPSAAHPLGSFGVFVWLLAQDLRLWRRELLRAFSRLAPTQTALALILGVIVLHVMVWPLAGRTIALGDGPGGRAAIETQFALAGIVLASIVVAAAMRRTIDLIFRRGGLDLLIGSPLPPAVIVAAQITALAFKSGAIAALFWIPFANDAALQGEGAWLAIYPAMVVGAFAASVVGMALGLALFARFGPRRVRGPALIVQVALGLTYFPAMGAVQILPDAWLEPLAHPAAGSPFAHGGALFAPIRAALGDSGAIAGWSVVSIAFFALACAQLGRRLLAASASAGGFVAARPRRRPFAAFASDARAALIAKERRLMLRNPGLLSLGAMFIVMFAPIAAQDSRDGWQDQNSLVVMVTILFAGQFAGALAAMAIACEEVPDLIGCAPLGEQWILRRKIESFAPGLAVAILGPCAFLSCLSPWSAFCAGFFGLGGAVNVAWLAHWTRALNRPHNGARRTEVSPLSAILMQIVCAAWTAAGALANLKFSIALLPLVAALLAMWAARPRGTARIAPASVAQQRPDEFLRP